MKRFVVSVIAMCTGWACSCSLSSRPPTPSPPRDTVSSRTRRPRMRSGGLAPDTATRDQLSSIAGDWGRWDDLAAYSARTRLCDRQPDGTGAGHLDVDVLLYLDREGRIVAGRAVDAGGASADPRGRAPTAASRPKAFEIAPREDSATGVACSPRDLAGRRGSRHTQRSRSPPSLHRRREVAPGSGAGQLGAAHPAADLDPCDGGLTALPGAVRASLATRVRRAWPSRSARLDRWLRARARPRRRTPVLEVTRPRTIDRSRTASRSGSDLP